ncbi:MAG TPA: DUF4129 domain-containing protein, partial [Ktedonobacteraceae bacterium]|nr:DUF4129 domain-containing protein [Ktedonobacteraceae bacterium]
IVTHPALLTSIPALVTVAGLTVWFWRRGMKLAPVGASDSYLIVAFKICFLALLILLFCTVLYFSQTYPDTPAFNALHVAMGSGLAIFFLSGLVCMSLTRLSIIKREDAYRAPGKSLTDPIRLWLVGLLLFWIGVTVLALAIETFSFGAVTNGALWLWNGFWNVMGGLLSLLAPLLAGLARLFSFLFPYFHIPRLTGPTSRPINTGSAQGATPLPDYVIQSIRLVVVLILLAVLVFVIRAILRRWQVKTRDDSEEEVREGLSMQVVWRQRRAEQGKRRQQASADPDLETLPANSARYHFRALLQALAERDDLARRDDETPEEYKIRLLSVLKQTVYSGDEQVDQRQLEALIEAYMRERYGGEVSDMLDDTSLPEWIQDFTRRLER